MDQPFVVRHGPTGVALTLSQRSRESYEATLKANRLTARAQVYHIGGDWIGRFFRSLADDWRGWEGERTWHSIEYQLSLTATTDRAGHVALAVSLSDHGWTATAPIRLEAGELERIASQAEAFAKHLGAAV